MFIQDHPRKVETTSFSPKQERYRNQVFTVFVKCGCEKNKYLMYDCVRMSFLVEQFNKASQLYVNNMGNVEYRVFGAEASFIFHSILEHLCIYL